MWCVYVHDKLYTRQIYLSTNLLVKWICDERIHDKVWNKFVTSICTTKYIHYKYVHDHAAPRSVSYSLSLFDDRRWRHARPTSLSYEYVHEKYIYIHTINMYTIVLLHRQDTSTRAMLSTSLTYRRHAITTHTHTHKAMPSLDSLTHSLTHTHTHKHTHTHTHTHTHRSHAITKHTYTHKSNAIPWIIHTIPPHWVVSGIHNIPHHASRKCVTH